MRRFSIGISLGRVEDFVHAQGEELRPDPGSEQEKHASEEE